MKISVFLSRSLRIIRARMGDGVKRETGGPGRGLREISGWRDFGGFGRAGKFFCDKNFVKNFSGIFFQEFF